MDAAEAHVQTYLLHLGLSDVRHEPDGNQPPDFLTRDGVAIEVRRLNQHFVTQTDTTALEHDSFPLLNGMRRLLAARGSASAGHGWWVTYYFHRPTPPWKQLQAGVRRLLDEIEMTGMAPSERIRVQRGFEVRFTPYTSPQPKRFQLGGFSDYNAGGWLYYELQKNLQICVDEKTLKIAPYRERYARWWLILVDQVGLASGTMNSHEFYKHVHITHSWTRVTLLDRHNYTLSLDIPSTPASAHKDAAEA